MLGELVESECIKYGNFKLKSGEVSKYYFDMKGLVSYPSLLKKIGDEMYKKIGKECDLLCGVPIGGLPVCSYISTVYNIPMIMVRNESKGYGTNKQIEGKYEKKNKCIIIEDVITTGGSVNKVIELLKDKVEILGVIVIMDRQEGYKCEVPVNSIITKTDVVKYRLGELIKKKKSRLCFSGDVEKSEELINMLDKIGDKIVICKIHYDFYDDKDGSLKKRLIELSIEHEFLLMEDRKFVDISHTVERQYSKYSKWVDMVTVMGNVHSEVISKLSGAVLIANMSNNSYNSTETAIETSKIFPERILGFVTQHRIGDSGFYNMTPGINITSSSVGDQNYRKKEDVDTDIIIVGRGIYNYDDYAEKAKCYSMI